MKSFPFVAVIVIAALTCGCSSVNLAYQLNPNLSASPTFHKVFVIAEFHDLAGRATAEDNFCNEIAGSTTADCVASHTLFFTGQRYSKKEVQAKIKALGADAVLTVTPSGGALLKDTQETDVFGNPVGGQKVQKAYGNYMTTPDARPAYRIVLRDAASQQIVWYGSTVARKEGDFDDYTSDSADKAVDAMVKSGILQAKP